MNFFRPLYFFLFCFCTIQTFAQQSCDTVLIRKIINIRLKEFDKQFNKYYPIYKYSEIQYEYLQKKDSLYPKYYISDKIDWTGYNLKTKFGYFIDNFVGKDTCLYIISPRLNNDLNKFCINFIFDFKGISYWHKYYFVKKRKSWSYDSEEKGVSY